MLAARLIGALGSVDDLGMTGELAVEAFGGDSAIGSARLSSLGGVSVRVPTGTCSSTALSFTLSWLLERWL